MQMLKVETISCHFSILMFLKGWIWFLCFKPKGVLSQIEIHFKVVEECISNTVIGNIHTQVSKLSDRGPYNDYFYKAIGEIDPFYLDTRTFDFKVAKRIDREILCSTPQTYLFQNCQKTFKFIQTKMLKDESKHSEESTPQIIIVHVEILDINDNSPKWTSSQFNFELPEHSKIGEEISLPLASDPDQSPTNTTQKYTIVHQSLKDSFRLKHTGNATSNEKLRLVVNRDFDREVYSTINIKLKAFDGGPVPLSGQLDINISLTDINDKQPHFKRTSIHKTINENLALKTLILQLEAKDEDESDQQNLRFQFDNSVDETIKNRFFINPNTGEIFTAGYIDYEIKSEYSIPILVTDGKHFDRTILTIEVKNLNDNAPEITVLYLSGSNFKVPRQSTQYQAYIAENKEPGFVLASLTVSDKDYESKRGSGPLTHLLDCKMESNKENLELRRNLLKLNDHFQIVTAKTFDREETSNYFAHLICFDSDINPLSTSVTFEIIVTDVNDCAPVFEFPQDLRGIPSFTIKEGAPIGTMIGQLKAVDRDVGNNAYIQYSLDPSLSNFFNIDPITGELRNVDVFDFEKTENFELIINASNPLIEKKNSVLQTTLQKISVIIEDINDCPPVFLKDLYTFSIKEGPSKDALVGRVEVKDDDVSAVFNSNFFKMNPNPNDYVESTDFLPYSNTNGNPSEYFRVKETGFIYVKVPVLDREKVSSFSFKIMASDRSDKPLSSTTIVQIKIIDVNDNAPSWIFPNAHSFTVNVSYHEPFGHCIAQLKTNDPDLGDNGKISYRIVHSRFPSPSNQFNQKEEIKSPDATESSENKFKRHDIFDLDSLTGNIYIAQKMSINDVGPKAIWVEASDQGSPPMKTVERLLVYIINTDNNGRGSSQGQLNKQFGLSRATFENDLMIMIVLVAVIILVALVMVIIILMLRCRNTGCLLSFTKYRNDTAQRINSSQTFLERRPDGHSCSPVNEIFSPYRGPKRSQTISTYLGQSAGSTQMLDLTNGYMTDPNSRMQLDGDNCDFPICQSMNRIPINQLNSTFAKKYYTSSSLCRPNVLWSTDGSIELSKPICQKLTNNAEKVDEISATSTINLESVENLNNKDKQSNCFQGNAAKKSVTLPNFLIAIEECDDPSLHRVKKDEPKFTFHQLSNIDKAHHKQSVTWLDKFNNQFILNSNKTQPSHYRSADMCPEGAYLETQGSRDHEYTQLSSLPTVPPSGTITHTDYPVTYV